MATWRLRIKHWWEPYSIRLAQWVHARGLNFVKPWYWWWLDRNKPSLEIPPGYTEFVPYVYNTGDGFIMGWALMSEAGYPESILDVIDGIRDDDEMILNFPFIFDWASTDDFSRIGIHVM